MNKPKFSIVVVSLNTKSDFLKTLDSIINQTFKDYQIIVVDGDSSDGTKDEILKNKNKIDKFIIEKDQGIYDAMNKGIKYIDGDWTVFLNSGDIFYSKTLLDEINDMELNNSDIIYGNTIIKNDFFSYILSSKNFDEKSLIMSFCHQSSFVKSILMKENLYNLDYILSSDFDLFHKLYQKKKKFVKLDKLITIVKSGGIADKNRIQVFNENQIILKRSYNRDYTFNYLKYKIYEILKIIIKSVLPKKILFLFLKIKYHKRTVK